MTRVTLGIVLVSAWFVPTVSFAQMPSKAGPLKPPEPGYVYPPGAKAGSTVDVHLGGFDWTPDVDVFVLDSPVKLEPTGTLGPVLVPPPPYWFGAKSTLNAPLLPRERPAKLTIPANTPPGPVRWVAANANGGGARTGTLWVGSIPDVLEEPPAKTPQKLPALPVAVSGRLSRIEEVDRYRFTVAKDGPVTCGVFARRLGVDMHPAVTIRDAAGKVVADAVDTDGQDLALTFAATAGIEYTLSLHDLDFRGDRAFVYRLALTPGPRVVATVPAVGKRGETRDVEFVIANGRTLESVTRKVTFPAAGAELVYRLETPTGTAPEFEIPLGDHDERVAGNEPLTVPIGVTGALEDAPAKFSCEGKKGDVWEVAAESRRFGSPLDVSVAVLAPDGKELARNDDRPGTTDARLTFTVPADGTYTFAVADSSGRIGTRASVYRLSLTRPTVGFALSTAARVNVPVDGKAELAVTAKRTGGFKEPIALTVSGLPDGVTVPAELVIPADKPELKIPVTAAANAPAVAALLTVTGTAGNFKQVATAPAPGNLAARSPDDERTSTVLLATTLKPRLKLVSVEADGGRKVHRGSTFPAPVTLEYFEGFAGEVSLQMSAAQSYQRQGITGPDLTLPPGTKDAFYPCFMPEWLETTRTSRMELVGVVQVPDARGKVRHLVTPMAGRITMSIEGALLKVEAANREVKVTPGETAVVTVGVLRSPKLAEGVKLELVLPEGVTGFTAEPVGVAVGSPAADFRIACAKDTPPGESTVTVRGTALQDGKYRVVSETTVTVTVGK